jgi:hypothetical protein
LGAIASCGISRDFCSAAGPQVGIRPVPDGMAEKLRKLRNPHPSP